MEREQDVDAVLLYAVAQVRVLDPFRVERPYEDDRLRDASLLGPRRRYRADGASTGPEAR
jgi:hypothetical protein